ncbi:hypothetical protein INR49_024778 [Caranx melampygus]|nr:hypothetical protein INR49_024778 [Caranx melampygus]
MVARERFRQSKRGARQAAALFPDSSPGSRIDDRDYSSACLPQASPGAQIRGQGGVAEEPGPHVGSTDVRVNRLFHLSHALPSVLSTVCNCDLARSGFFQKKGEYICTADYQRLYGTRCDRCDSFITGEVVSALGRTYHPKCFVCSVCSKPFPIGDRVTFSGKDCVCQQCSHTLVKSNEPIKIHGPSRKSSVRLALDGVPYCEADYHAQYGVKCETCSRYISGRVLEMIGQDDILYSRKHMYMMTCPRQEENTTIRPAPDVPAVT